MQPVYPVAQNWRAPVDLGAARLASPHHLLAGKIAGGFPWLPRQSPGPRCASALCMPPAQCADRDRPAVLVVYYVIVH